MENNILPDGWEWKTLGGVSISQSGAGFPKTYQGQTDGDFPFAKVSDITNAVKNNGGTLVSAANYLSSTNAKRLHAKEFPVGTTLFAKIGEAIHLNRRAIVSAPVLADNNVMGLIPLVDIVSPKFLFYFMHTIDLYEYSQATTVPSVRKSDVENISFPLPPLLEQKRIVSRIEEFFSDLDAGVAALECVRAGLKRYKASVLKAACEGKLVNGKSEIGESELPEGWHWDTVGEIAEIIGGVTKGRKFSGQKTVMLPYLRVANVQRGRLDLDEMKEIELLENEIEKYRLQDGDVVLTEGGDWDKLGRSSDMAKSD